MRKRFGLSLILFAILIAPGITYSPDAQAYGAVIGRDVFKFFFEDMVPVGTKIVKKTAKKINEIFVVDTKKAVENLDNATKKAKNGNLKIVKIKTVKGDELTIPYEDAIRARNILAKLDGIEEKEIVELANAKNSGLNVDLLLEEEGSNVKENIVAYNKIFKDASSPDNKIDGSIEEKFYGELNKMARESQDPELQEAVTNLEKNGCIAGC